MGRSGYSDDAEGDWSLYRANVKRAITGKRGQTFLREMLIAMDGLPEKRLVSEVFMQSDGQVCAIGSVGRARGTDMTKLDPENYDYEEWDFSGGVAKTFRIAHPMAAEIMHVNDSNIDETPEERFVRVRKWVVENIRPAN